jgi:hypothetical protein
LFSPTKKFVPDIEPRGMVRTGLRRVRTTHPTLQDSAPGMQRPLVRFSINIFPVLLKSDRIGKAMIAICWRSDRGDRIPNLFVQWKVLCLSVRVTCKLSPCYQQLSRNRVHCPPSTVQPTNQPKCQKRRQTRQTLANFPGGPVAAHKSAQHARAHFLISWDSRFALHVFVHRVPPFPSCSAACALCILPATPKKGIRKAFLPNIKLQLNCKMSSRIIPRSNQLRLIRYSHLVLSQSQSLSLSPYRQGPGYGQSSFSTDTATATFSYHTLTSRSR